MLSCILWMLLFFHSLNLFVESSLDLKADKLRDLRPLSKFFDQFEVGKVLDVVLERRQDQVKNTIWIELKVTNKTLNIFFHLFDWVCIYLFLVKFDYQFWESFAFFAHEIELLLGVERLSTVLYEHPLHAFLVPNANVLNCFSVKDLVCHAVRDHTTNLQTLKDFFGSRIVPINLLFIIWLNKLPTQLNGLQKAVAEFVSFIEHKITQQITFDVKWVPWLSLTLLLSLQCFRRLSTFLRGFEQVCWSKLTLITGLSYRSLLLDFFCTIHSIAVSVYCGSVVGFPVVDNHVLVFSLYLISDTNEVIVGASNISRQFLCFELAINAKIN